MECFYVSERGQLDYFMAILSILNKRARIRELHVGSSVNVCHWKLQYIPT